MTEEKETYRGNCRCAAFVFEVTIPKIKEVEICKCSICYKKNYAFLFVDKKDLRVVKGSMEDFTTYTFGEGIMKHMFCPKCSMMTVCTHGKFPDQYVVNARSLQGPVDIWNMPKTVDPGKEHKPDYVPPDDSDLPEPKAEIEGESKIYHGSCHCGDIRVKLKMEPWRHLDLLESTAGHHQPRLVERQVLDVRRGRGEAWRAVLLQALRRLRG
ncbi:hypothetical protein OOU_Y34scaffold00464g108 [Pyricularia oryzae Y34]|uniref:CENP-V/GFA domain-containing protein n=1 Tax=Pyricularia oryzae (strain Y34) TaxID=1143189 RepID=A0AA97P0W7_PYRO3|nr:hypothetical protein OOU_Y34scaffold00464g108 [Pyricularia oryzae Y34]